MSIAGNMAMAVLRLVKPGRRFSGNMDHMIRQAEKENVAFRFSLPKSQKADYGLCAGVSKPCLMADAEEYGGQSGM